MIRFDSEGLDPDLFDAEIAALSGADADMGATFLGIPLCDTMSVMQLGVQFLINLLVCSAIVWLFYYPKSHRKDFADRKSVV